MAENDVRQTIPPIARRPIDIEVGWCAETQEYEGTISFPPDGVNGWIILHEEADRSLSVVEARLSAARLLPSWPCRYCSDWMLKHTSMFQKDGVCEVCLGAKRMVNPDFRCEDVMSGSEHLQPAQGRVPGKLAVRDTSDPQSTLAQKLWRLLPRSIVGWLRCNLWTPDWDTPFCCSVHEGRRCPKSCWQKADQPTCLGDPTG